MAGWWAATAFVYALQGTGAVEPVTEPTLAVPQAASPAEVTGPAGFAAFVTDVSPVDELAEPPEPRGQEAARAAGGPQGGGGASFVFGFLWSDQAVLDNLARQLNFGADGFPGGPFETQGIHAFGYIGRNFRVGGMLAEGSKSIIDDSSAVFLREVDVTAAHIGLTLEYVYPTRRWEFYGGGMLGSGEYEVRYAQQELRVRNEQADWDDLVGDLSGTPRTATFAKTLRVNYLAVNPWVGVKFKVVPWFGIDVSAGYLWGRAGAGRWEFGDSVRPVTGSPAVDASGPTLRAAASFGLFPH